MDFIFYQFEKNFSYIGEIAALHKHLIEVSKLPNDISDLLRTEYIYSVSALDKLVHELVRYGMLEAFRNVRGKTNKFKAFSINTNTYFEILNPTNIQPVEYWFEQEIILQHKTLSFQAPDKIAEILSLIWAEEHKWQKISAKANMNERDMKIKLKNIVNRRNQIVHEADLNIQTGDRNSIDMNETSDVVDFIYKLGKSIYENVKLN
jgi:hypothetical protein